MTTLWQAGAGLLVTMLSPSVVNAASFGGLVGTVAGSSIVEPAHVYTYTRVCSFGPRGWWLRTDRGQLIACRPHRSSDFGWSWREEGGRRGWYHSRDRIWR